ncbi:hypothetical protein MUP05_06555 [Candidatus Bathyarchaeota archaeon]|nr:hypothetical protein [Candidatus Bathyarchaeota archaeon]
MSQPELTAIKFTYRKQSMTPHNWETMPFYVRYLRGFLQEHDGDAVWLKGNTGGEESAYLLFRSELREELIRLMAQPLADLGFYEVASVRPSEVAPFIFRKDRVGSLLIEELEIGRSLDELTHKIREGFWYAPIGTVTGAIRLKAKSFTRKLHEGEAWFCLHDAEETICRSDGTPVATRKHEELWLRESALRTVSRLLPLLAILVMEAIAS